MGALRMVILDTCALLWWTLDPVNLSARAKEVCAKIKDEGAFISSITIWEIGIKMKKKILDIGVNLEGYVARLKRLGTVEIIPVDEDIWIKNISLPWGHGDLADRTIVATAAMQGLPIVTKDKVISDFYPQIIW
jgi:PIN domain nuclease of toxin-antitoxin system